MGKNNKPSILKDILKNLTKKQILENAKKEKEKSYDIRIIFQQMELDLIASLHRAFYFHKQEQEKEGFSWEQWQLSKLRSIEEYRKRNMKLVDKYSDSIQKTIDKELKKKYNQGQNRLSNSLNDGYVKVHRKKIKNKNEHSIGIPEDIAEKQKTREYIAKELGRETTPPQDNDFFGMNDKKLNALQEAVENDLKKAQYSVLRKMDDIYRQTIFKTHVYMQSGTKSLNQAIDMATKDFLNKGIDSITYKDGKKVNIASYAEMCLRTASQRATFLGEGKKRDEWGIHLVVVSAHANTCKMCAYWQGKVLIDDVFSHPSKEYIEEYSSKYKLLSEAIKAGLIHPNCRHTLITYFEGITQIPEVQNEEEAIKTYEAEQKQRALERAIRKQKRIAQGTCSKDNIKTEKAKLKVLEKRLREHLNAHKELRRNYEREDAKYNLVIQETEKVSRKNNHNSVNWDIIKSKEYKDKFNRITNNSIINNLLYKKTMNILKHRNNTDYEDMYLIDSIEAKVVAAQTHSDKTETVSYNDELKRAILKSKEETLISIHNHPNSMPPSGGDFNAAFNYSYKKGIVICHNGSIFVYEKGKTIFSNLEYELLVAKHKSRDYTISEYDALIRALDELKEKYKIKYKEL